MRHRTSLKTWKQWEKSKAALEKTFSLGKTLVGQVSGW